MIQETIDIDCCQVVSNELSFPLHYLGGISSFKTESYEQLNDVKFEGFKLHNPPAAMVSTELVQIHANAKELF